MAKKSIAATKTARRPKTPTRPLTIYDGEKYFDVKFSAAERDELTERIMLELGFKDRCLAHIRVYDLLSEAEGELLERLRLYPSPADWLYIHVCRQLEIDYKSFAKNVPRLPIEPFYQFVEPLFPQSKPAKNAMQRTVQTQHIHLAFIDWIDFTCPEHGCTRESHGPTCWDRFEKPDYEAAARRVCARNAARPKFAPLKLVHSR